MKRSLLIVTMLAAALTAMAQQQTQSQPRPQPPTRAAQAASMSAAVQKPAEKQVEVFTPLTKKLPLKSTDKVERVDGLSSQPWSKMAGSRPGWSAFSDPERHDAAFDVFWIGAPPTH
jgi:hypothetical protein